MAIAAIGQICSGPSMAKNLEQCVKLAGKAAAAGAQILFLPEASDYIASSPTESLSLAKPQSTSPFVTGLQSAALHHKIAIHVGIHVPSTIPSPTHPDKVKLYNRTIYIDQDGTIDHPYDKLHLFDYPASGLLESSTTQQGDYHSSSSSSSSSPDSPPPPFNSPIGRLGSLICFDLRFPEAGLRLSRPSSSPSSSSSSSSAPPPPQPAHILLYPSAFTVPTGRAGHWEVLLRARAIEGQCWVIASAQVGRHPMTGGEGEGETKPGKRVSFGESMVVDPWGEVRCRLRGVVDVNDNNSNNNNSSVGGGSPPQWEAEEGAIGELGIVDIDLGVWESVREKMPLVRRYDVYPEI